MSVQPVHHPDEVHRGRDAGYPAFVSSLCRCFRVRVVDREEPLFEPVRLRRSSAVIFTSARMLESVPFGNGRDPSASMRPEWKRKYSLGVLSASLGGDYFKPKVKR